MPATIKFILVFFSINIVHYSLAQSTGYWQQNVDYVIRVSLDDVNNELTGTIQITYTNNSPDVLDFIWMHAWPNAYKNNATAFARQELLNGDTKFKFSKDIDKGFIDELNFKVNSKDVSWQFDVNNIDMIKIFLNEPLQSGKSIVITTPFRVKIPASFSRMGYVGQSYQISQWYPKPAVYDKYGWHAMPYLDQGEFYSEFGNYDVTITLPSNYIVAASGNLQTQSEIDFLNAKAEETKSLNTSDKDVSFPPSSAETKTINYTLKNAHDFAWFADKRFHVLKGQVILPLSQRTVTTWTYFTNLQADLWINSIDYVNRAVLSYSSWIGEYQYDVAQAVEGALSAGAGMEYPTVTIIGKASDALTLDDVITHEVGHNWFYGMLGTNERDYAWMDEGINTYYENRYLKTYYGNKGLQALTGIKSEKINEMFGLQNKDVGDVTLLINSILEKENKAQPVQSTSTDFTLINYGLDVYEKTAYLFRYMSQFLGEGQFDRIMGIYFNTWKFKHPYPEDMQKIFETETGENFNWFFNGLLKDDRSLDYKIGEIMVGKNTVSARVTNQTNIPAPFPISLVYKDSIIKTDWQRGFTGSENIFLNKKTNQEITAVKIDAAKKIPEYERENNVSKTKGLFKRTEPLQMKFLISLTDNPDKTTITYSPLIAGNYNNGLMLGLGIWNSTLPEPKLEYVLAPMYAVKSKNFAGQGSIGLNIYPENGIFDRLRISEFVSHYNYLNIADAAFSKYEFKIDMSIKPKYLNAHTSQTLSYRNIFVQETGYDFFTGQQAEINVAGQQYDYNELKYEFKNTRKLKPWSVKATLQQNKDFLKPFAEFNYRLNYPKQIIGVDVRVFAGTITPLADNSIDAKYFYTVSGGDDFHDYLYDDIFFERNIGYPYEVADGNNFLNNQLTMRDGFLKIYSNDITLTGNKYMLACNFEFALPFKLLPLALFADFVQNGSSQLPSDFSAFAYDAGIMLRLPDNIFEIYFPLLASKNYPDLFSGKYGENISFMLNLNALNPFEIARKLKF